MGLDVSRQGVLPGIDGRENLGEIPPHVATQLAEIDAVQSDARRRMLAASEVFHECIAERTRILASHSEAPKRVGSSAISAAEVFVSD